MTLKETFCFHERLSDLQLVGVVIIIADRNSFGLGVSVSPRGSISETKRNEQTKKVLEILSDNKNGLTSLQIGMLMGDRMRRDILWRLQKEGKVRQKRGILDNGKIGFVYVLNLRKQS